MKYMRLLYGRLYASAVFVFLLCVLLPHNAAANPSADKVIRFGICPDNIKSVLVTQEVGANVWYFVFTLNSVGTKQFRQMETTKHFVELVEVDWDGVSFGRVQFVNVVNIANASDAKYIHLQSQGWHSLSAAEAQMKLLGNKSLNVPCGKLAEP